MRKFQIIWSNFKNVDLFFSIKRKNQNFNKTLTRVPSRAKNLSLKVYA